MNNYKTKTAIAAGLASTVFIGGMVGLPTGFIGDLLISVPLSVLTGIGIMRFWPSTVKKTKKENTSDLKRLIEQNIKDSTLNPNDVLDAIELGSRKLKRIEEITLSFRNPNVKRRVKNICNIGYKILENFKNDPNDVKMARTWLNSHLDQCVEITEQYAKLSKSPVQSIEIQKQMVKFEDILDLMEITFNDLLKKMVEDDLISFDVNVQVFKNILKNEGI